MSVGYRSQCIPQFRVLSDDQIEAIHRATLEVLETVGVQVKYDKGAELLAGAGCRVVDGDRVLIPNWLVEECILSAPSRITIYDRGGAEAMRLEGRNIHFGLGTDLIHTGDLRTGELRLSVLQDVADSARVADACADIDFIASNALPSDVPTNAMYAECFRAMVQNSSKPIFFTAGGSEDLEFILQMAAAVVGGDDALSARPFLIHYSEPTSPLMHSYGAVRKLLLCADRGIPICYVPSPIMGGSAPVTLAGGIVQANAEALSGIVLHQLRCKGAPIISGWGAQPLDMSTTIAPYAAPEIRLTDAAYVDLYLHYGIPTWGTLGADSYVLDAQAGMEHALATVFPALSGANLIHDAGYLGQGLVGDLSCIVMADEIIGYVKRIMRGFDLGREAMAVDVIRRVGPGGSYLGEEHTLKHFRREAWQPRDVNRDDIDVWRAEGCPTYESKLCRRAMELLSTHQPAPLPERVRQRLAEIADEARRELAGKSFRA